MNGEDQKAVEFFKEAIRADPTYASAHYNLGPALFQKGDKAAALDEYRILKKLDQQAAEKLFNLLYY